MELPAAGLVVVAVEPRLPLSLCLFGQGKVENENKHSGGRTCRANRTYHALQK